MRQNTQHICTLAWEPIFHHLPKRNFFSRLFFLWDNSKILLFRNCETCFFGEILLVSWVAFKFTSDPKMKELFRFWRSLRIFHRGIPPSSKHPPGPSSYFLVVRQIRGVGVHSWHFRQGNPTRNFYQALSKLQKDVFVRLYADLSNAKGDNAWPIVAYVFVVLRKSTLSKRQRQVALHLYFF